MAFLSPTRAGFEVLSVSATFMRRRGIDVFAYVASLVFMIVWVPRSAPQTKATEADIKAAYILNFGKFVHHSAEGKAATALSRFNICVLGTDATGNALKQASRNEQIGGHPVRLIEVKSPPDFNSCNIAYISSSEGDRIDRALEVLKDQETLTVSDASDFLKRGGIIQFVLIGNHVRFSVNLNAVRDTHLVLSSELLRVAYSVSGAVPGGTAP